MCQNASGHPNSRHQAHTSPPCYQVHSLAQVGARGEPKSVHAAAAPPSTQVCLGLACCPVDCVGPHALHTHDCHLPRRSHSLSHLASAAHRLDAPTATTTTLATATPRTSTARLSQLIVPGDTLYFAYGEPTDCSMASSKRGSSISWVCTQRDRTFCYWWPCIPV